MEQRSRGAVHLEQVAVEKRGAIQKSLDGTGVSYESLRRYIRGITVPSIADALALQVWSDGRVRVEDWAVPDPSPDAAVPDPGAGLRAAAAALGVDPDAAPGDVMRALDAGPTEAA